MGGAAVSYSVIRKGLFDTEGLSRELNNMTERAMRTQGRSSTGKGNRMYGGPEAGTCLACPFLCPPPLHKTNSW